MSISSTVPPYERIAACLVLEDVEGMMTVQRFFKSIQAYATACPKLPDEAVITSSLCTGANKLYAALNLKLPVTCNVSLAIVTSAPRLLSSRKVLWKVVGLTCWGSVAHTSLMYSSV